MMVGLPFQHIIFRLIVLVVYGTIRERVPFPCGHVPPTSKENHGFQVLVPCKIRLIHFIFITVKIYYLLSWRWKLTFLWDVLVNWARGPKMFLECGKEFFTSCSWSDKLSYAYWSASCLWLISFYIWTFLMKAG